MATLGSWLSPGVMHSLGWALIHSLWQCLGIAALAVALMALFHRPSTRYVLATGALVAMLALPVSTFFVLMRSTSTPIHALLPATSGSLIAGMPHIINVINVSPVAAKPTSNSSNMVSAFEHARRSFSSLSNFPPNALPWLVGAWLCGVALFSLRLAGGFLLLEQKRHRQSCAPSSRVLAICQELQRQLGLNRVIRYLECSWLQAPAVIGWFHPIVMLPVVALTGLSEEQLRAVVAHELSHIRRFDAVVNLFQILVETLLFYHPAMWWLNKRIRAEREFCCDEIAVSLTGNRLEYARALTRMAEWKTAPVLAMAANRGPLSERVLHILGRKSSDAGQRMLGLSGGALFMIAALAAANTLFAIGYPVRVAHANETPQLVPPSIQARGGLDAPQALQAIIPATKIADKTPGQTNRNDATGHEIANAPPDQLDPVKIAQADVLPTPSPVAPSRLLPIQEPVPAAIEASNDLPSGVHDPDALTCDAPQLVSLAKLVGWRICVQNSILATFGETGAMSPGGTVIRSSSDLAMSYKPTGEGDPDAVTCLEQQGTETRFRGPIACAHNDFWAKLNARGCTLSPNAKAIIRSETTKNLNPLACTHVPGRNGVLPPVFF